MAIFSPTTDDFYEERKDVFEAGTATEEYKTIFEERLYNHLVKLGLLRLTGIQKQTIDFIRPGPEIKHYVVHAKTGSGKTLAFVLPLINNLLNSGEKITRESGCLALVFSPTKELVAQTNKILEKVTNPFPYMVCGTLGVDKAQSEKKRLSKGVTILVSTPGRVAYHLCNTTNFNCSQLKYIVMDEVDRLMDLCFGPQLFSIVGLLACRVSGLSDQAPLSSLQRLDKVIKTNYSDTPTSRFSNTKPTHKPTPTPETHDNFQTIHNLPFTLVFVSATIPSSSQELIKCFCPKGFVTCIENPESVSVRALPSGLQIELAVIPLKQQLIALIAIIRREAILHPEGTGILILTDTCETSTFLKRVLESIQFPSETRFKGLAGNQNISKNARERILRETKISSDVSMTSSESDESEESDNSDISQESETYSTDEDSVSSDTSISTKSTHKEKRYTFPDNRIVSNSTKSSVDEKILKNKTSDDTDSLINSELTSHKSTRSIKLNHMNCFNSIEFSNKSSNVDIPKKRKNEMESKLNENKELKLKDKRIPVSLLEKQSLYTKTYNTPSYNIKNMLNIQYPSYEPYSLMELKSSDSIKTKCCPSDERIFNKKSILRAIHGKMSGAERVEVIDDFVSSVESGRLGILIATDVASRGIDISAVDTVLQFDVPRSFDEFQHRSGRTARLGKSGKSIVFALEDTEKHWSEAIQTLYSITPKVSNYSSIIASGFPIKFCPEYCTAKTQLKCSTSSVKNTVYRSFLSFLPGYIKEIIAANSELTESARTAFLVSSCSTRGYPRNMSPYLGHVDLGQLANRLGLTEKPREVIMYQRKQAIDDAIKCRAKARQNLQRDNINTDNLPQAARIKYTTRDINTAMQDLKKKGIRAKHFGKLYRGGRATKVTQRTHVARKVGKKKPMSDQARAASEFF